MLFGYLAAIAPKLELVTGIIILPQRQTALVAKQAAEVDVLTGGRFRLGIGQGWNPVEYEALGEDFAGRASRMEEQIELLRRLWQEPVVDFEGRDHKVTAAGLNPLPVQRPIPIWMGGSSEPALERIARLGDGWFPMNGQALEGDWQLTLDRMREWRAGRRARSGRPRNRGAHQRVDRHARTTGTGRPRSGGRSARRTSRSTRCAAASSGADAHLERVAAAKDASSSASPSPRRRATAAVTGRKALLYRPSR